MADKLISLHPSSSSSSSANYTSHSQYDDKSRRRVIAPPHTGASVRAKRTNNDVGGAGASVDVDACVNGVKTCGGHDGVQKMGRGGGGGCGPRGRRAEVDDVLDGSKEGADQGGWEEEAHLDNVFYLLYRLVRPRARALAGFVGRQRRWGGGDRMVGRGMICVGFFGGVVSDCF